jgi:RNA polymerase sigma-70 factor (ECF subfamily)
MTEPDDGELWCRIRADDPAAFGLLFERHGPQIHGFATRRTGDPSAADDIVAMVFLEAWRRRRAVELRSQSAAPWLYGVATNVIHHRQRTSRRHRDALDRLAALPPAAPINVERQAQAAHEAAAVVEQVRRLPRRDRDVLVLSVWEGLSHAEIAVALDTNVGTVKSRLSRARARLDPDRPLPAADPPAAPRAAPTPSVLTAKEPS